jgi:hypothetical protein
VINKLNEEMHKLKS